jgi:hypothetical protein
MEGQWQQRLCQAAASSESNFLATGGDTPHAFVTIDGDGRAIVEGATDVYGGNACEPHGHASSQTRRGGVDEHGAMVDRRPAMLG